MPDVRPQLLLAGIPYGDIQAIRGSLETSGYDVLEISSPGALLQRVEDRRCFAVILNASFSQYPLSLVEEARSRSRARWIVYARNPDAGFRKEAKRVGVTSVLEHPIEATPAIVLARQMLAEEGAAFRQQSSALILPTGLIEAVPTDGYLHRREWPLGPKLQAERFGQHLDEQRVNFEGLLRRLRSDLGAGGRFRLLLFGLRAPVPEARPRQFVIVASSDSVAKGELLCDMRRYPEVLIAYERRAPLIAANIANVPIFSQQVATMTTAQVRSTLCVPLFRGADLFGMLTGSFPMEMADDGLAVTLRDLVGYAPELTAFASRFDFLSRAYRQYSAFRPQPASSYQRGL